MSKKAKISEAKTRREAIDDGAFIEAYVELCEEHGRRIGTNLLGYPEVSRLGFYSHLDQLKRKYCKKGDVP